MTPIFFNYESLMFCTACSYEGYNNTWLTFIRTVLNIMYSVHVYTCFFLNFAYWTFCIVIHLVVINYTYLLNMYLLHVLNTVNLIYRRPSWYCLFLSLLLVWLTCLYRLPSTLAKVFPFVGETTIFLSSSKTNL